MPEEVELYIGETRNLQEALTNAQNIIGGLLGENSDTFRKLDAALKSEKLTDLRAATIIIERAGKLFEIYPEYEEGNPTQVAKLKAAIQAITQRNI